MRYLDPQLMLVRCLCISFLDLQIPIYSSPGLHLRKDDGFHLCRINPNALFLTTASATMPRRFSDAACIPAVPTVLWNIQAEWAFQRESGSWKIRPSEEWPVLDWMQSFHFSRSQQWTWKWRKALLKRDTSWGSRIFREKEAIWSSSIELVF